MSTKHQIFYGCRRRLWVLLLKDRLRHPLYDEVEPASSNVFALHGLPCLQKLLHFPDREITVQADNLNMVLLQPVNIFERVPDVALVIPASPGRVIVMPASCSDVQPTTS